MQIDSTISEKQASLLRQNARDRLRTGSTPDSGSPLDSDALALLYEMASNPARSSDALRLLQELQVYQVELDLQSTQLESNEREMSRELAHYRAMFALTPTACLMVCTEGYIFDANPSAAGLLGVGQDELGGRLLIEFLKPESHAPWNQLLRQLQAGEQSVGGEVLVEGGVGVPGPARLSVSVSPGDDAVLLLVAG